MARTISDGHIRFMVLVLGGVFLLLALRLFQVQCLSHDKDLGDIGKLQSGSNRTRLVHIPQRRGKISDRNGYVLATDLPYYQIFIDPVALAPEQDWAVATNVASWFPDTDMQKLHEELGVRRANSNKFMVVGTTEDENLAALVRSLGAVGKPLRGIGALNRYRREYTMGSEASHVVGFVGNEGKGVLGIEKRFDKWLAGAPGHRWIYVNARGAEIRHLRDGVLDPRNGADIELTIDSDLQHVVDGVVDKYWRTTQSLAAWAIVYDCHTGEVLAMADRPTVDPVHPGSDFSTWLNRCVSFRYEPGSVMKPMTITGAMSAGVISPTQLISTELDGIRLDDHFHEKAGTPRDFIRKSSNRGTAQIALMMKREILACAYRGAGFGSRTGIELPAEDRGNLGRPERWTQLNLSRVGIGQSVDVTAIQLACAYGAIANDGVRMRPHIVRGMTDPNTGIALRSFQPEPVPGPAFTPQAARAMRDMLESVVTVDPGTREHGTGRRAAIPGYRVGGKTGTAQMLIREPGLRPYYSKTDYHASFCGIVPIDSPRYVIVVTLQRPLGLHGGGDVAAPAFAEIALQVARQYDLSATHTQMLQLDAEDFEPDPDGLADPFPDRDPEEEPNFDLDYLPNPLEPLP